MLPLFFEYWNGMVFKLLEETIMILGTEERCIYLHDFYG